MPAIEYLTPNEMQRLQSIDASYGQAGKFQEKAGIWRSTFKNIVRNGYGLFENVQKIRDAFAELDKDRELSPDEMLRIVADEYGVMVEALRRSGRNVAEQQARLVAANVLALETRLKDEAIAALLNQHRTSVIYAKKRISELMSNPGELDLRRKFWSIREKIQKH